MPDSRVQMQRFGVSSRLVRIGRVPAAPLSVWPSSSLLSVLPVAAAGGCKVTLLYFRVSNGDFAGLGRLARHAPCQRAAALFPDCRMFTTPPNMPGSAPGACHHPSSPHGARPYPALFRGPDCAADREARVEKR
jgi:hypothetical protein